MLFSEGLEEMAKSRLSERGYSGATDVSETVRRAYRNMDSYIRGLIKDGVPFSQMFDTEKLEGQKGLNSAKLENKGVSFVGAVQFAVGEYVESKEQQGVLPDSSLQEQEELLGEAGVVSSQTPFGGAATETTLSELARDVLNDFLLSKELIEEQKQLMRPWLNQIDWDSPDFKTLGKAISYLNDSGDTYVESAGLEGDDAAFFLEGVVDYTRTLAIKLKQEGLSMMMGVSPPAPPPSSLDTVGRKTLDRMRKSLDRQEQRGGQKIDYRRSSVLLKQVMDEANKQRASQQLPPRS